MTGQQDQADALVRSRQGLVDAQTNERRRLERQLRHGTHHHLDVLAAGLDDGARTAFDEGLEPVGRQLEELAAEIRLAGQEIEALARGMYPPVLEADGVNAAIGSLASGLPLVVTVESTLTTRLDLDIERAVYFTVAEALTNVVKHAEATTASVRIDRSGHELSFEVVDDGRGFDPGPRHGPSTGLAGLRDRVETVGGTLVVDSGPGRGTTVSGRIALGPVAALATAAGGG